MNSTPSKNSGSAGIFPMTCPRCGAPTVREQTCEHCGAPLPARGKPAEPPAAALPLDFRGLQRPKVSSAYSAGSVLLVPFAIFWTLFSLVFLIFGVGMAVKNQQTYDLLTREGRVVPGVVTALEVDDSSDSTDYIVHYRYSAQAVDQPGVYTQHQTVSESVYDSLEVGAAVPVICALSQPDVARLQATFGPPDWLGPLLMGGMGLLFVVIGLFMLSKAIVGLMDYYHLKREGQEMPATVFDRWEDKDSEGDASYIVAYVFKVFMPDGTLKQVTRAESNRKVFRSVQMGSVIQVRYVPNDPEICQIVRLP